MRCGGPLPTAARRRRHRSAAALHPSAPAPRLRHAPLAQEPQDFLIAAVREGSAQDPSSPQSAAGEGSAEAAPAAAPTAAPTGPPAAPAAVCSLDSNAPPPPAAAEAVLGSLGPCAESSPAVPAPAPEAFPPLAAGSRGAGAQVRGSLGARQEQGCQRPCLQALADTQPAWLPWPAGGPCRRRRRAWAQHEPDAQPEPQAEPRVRLGAGACRLAALRAGHGYMLECVCAPAELTHPSPAPLSCTA